MGLTGITTDSAKIYEMLLIGMVAGHLGSTLTGGLSLHNVIEIILLYYAVSLSLILGDWIFRRISERFTKEEPPTYWPPHRAS